MITARAQQAWMWEISTPTIEGGWEVGTEARFSGVRYFADVLRLYVNPGCAISMKSGIKREGLAC